MKIIKNGAFKKRRALYVCGGISARSGGRSESLMRRAALAAVVLCLALSLAACGDGLEAPMTAAPQSIPPEAAETSEIPEKSLSEGTEMTEMIYAHIGENVLEILPADNSSAEAFIDLLAEGDLAVEMSDYGGFEKVGGIGKELPRNDERITTEYGDVILYQGSSITIYYDINTWSFTRLGKVQKLSQDELKSVLGSGDVAVVFSLSE